MKHLTAVGLALLAACGTPGREVSPQPDDFAFVEVRLRG